MLATFAAFIMTGTVLVLLTLAVFAVFLAPFV